MNTTADKLELLLRTKERQKAYLQEKYPLLDFDTIPFRAYLDLFQGRSYVPGFVGGWKAYGRSNDEAADTRKYLKDYSGNGRDIELFNFGWTEDSGYNTTTYPGALVSDGVDDYGQCIKGFALPDDYTVAAIRKIFNTDSDSALASKSRTTGQGAFIFDINKGGYSYGNISSSPYNAPLFSYQTKTSYNGVEISPGSGTDTEDDALCLLKKGVNRGDYLSAALYDLRIYDHSLTTEELQSVKDEMMADYEAATGGGIDGITYVADWDAKGRSNDEEEPMRSQWIDKATGKVINLSNYSYSQMSGWNGYNFDFTQRWQSDLEFSGTVSVVKNAHKAVFTALKDTQDSINFYASYLNEEDQVIPAQKLRIRSSQKLTFSYGQEAGNYIEIPSSVEGDNYIVDIPECKIFLILINGPYSSGDVFTIEQLPLYPGALVSDGVDDGGRTEEILNDTIGTILMQARVITPQPGKYFFNADSEELNGRVYCLHTGGEDIAAGVPSTVVSLPFMAFSREPKLVNKNLSLGLNIAINSAIYRLILIKEQLDDAQLETLTWKISKEYRDWLKEKGYDYAIDEMLNN